MNSEAASAPGAVAPESTRWIQLVIGIICMALVANLQYGWTLFVTPIQEKYKWSLEAIQYAFFLFVLVETWLVPVEGWLVDKYGPRIVVAVGGVLVVAAWTINSVASSLPMLYAGAIIGGLGAGGVYGTCIGNAVKWFPDRRGLASGFTAAGFGAGAAITIIPISNMIESAGYERTFFTFALIQGIGVLVLSFILRAPRPGETPIARARVVQSTMDTTPRGTLMHPIFWVLYAMFVAVGIGGLIVTADLKPMAASWGIDKIPVELLGLTMPAITFALTIDRILNGITRPLFGWVSDHIGRENSMFIAFLLEALGFWLLMQFHQNPVAFVLISGTVFLFWGEIFSLFPATVGDIFGSKYAATNTGMMYTAKGTAAIAVPYVSGIAEKTQTWDQVFVVLIGLNLFASLCALLVLKPMIRKRVAQRG